MFLWFPLNFLNPMSFFSWNLQVFHELCLFFMLCLLILVIFMMMKVIFFQSLSLVSLEAYTLEFWWTMLPILILISLALPSMGLLYLSETPYFTPKLSIKIMGYQWYWGYQFSDFKNIEFDSYMIQSMDLLKGTFRLVEVDNRVILPFNMITRAVISSNDVLHSWTVPTLMLKADANPGRLNQMFLFSLYPGIFYGQCSEICGANHSFMPIVIEFTSALNFKLWALNFE